MKRLNISPQSDEFRQLQLQYIIKEDIHFIMGGSVMMPSDDGQSMATIFGLKELVQVKANGDRYRVKQPYRQVQSINWMNAKKHVEIKCVLNLQTMIAIRTYSHGDEIFTMLADFDGLEEGRRGKTVWVYLHWDKQSREVVNQIGYERFDDADQLFLLQLEHELLVADSSTAFVTVSDGTRINSITAQYLSDDKRRNMLLDHYANVSKMVREAKESARRDNGKPNGSR